MKKIEEGAAPVATMRKVFGFLVCCCSINYGKANKVFEGYCKKYGVWMDDPAPDEVILDAFKRYRD